MAELAFAARDLDTGYKKGDLISVLPDGWEWGTLDTLPNVWQVAMSGVPTSLVRPHVGPLHELALPGDVEFLAPDVADRKIERHRAKVRLMWDEIPIPWMTDLDIVGRLELRGNQLAPYLRELRYNRGQGRVEKTDRRIV